MSKLNTILKKGLISVCLIVFTTSGVFADTVPSGNIYDLPLESLMKIKVKSTSSLTKTSARKIPAATLKITKTDIEESGARNLYELLDIYVPNFQWLRHHYETSPMGIRGVISDRDDNTLLMVNDRVINERTHYGAIPEKNLVLLSDIHHIDIIRGSGSAMYGYGATTMVINIITKTAQTAQVPEIVTKYGATEEFQSIEVNAGHQIDEDQSVFVYGGVGHYYGAEQTHSPLIFGSSFNTRFGEAVVANEPVPYPINPDQASNHYQMPYKMHIDYNYKALNVWSRISKGGQQFAWNMPVTEYPNNYLDSQTTSLEKIPNSSSGYFQSIVAASYDHQLTKETMLTTKVGYDTTDYERALIDEDGIRQEAYREDEYFFSVLANIDQNNGSSLALGAEYSLEVFGLQSRSLSNVAPNSNQYRDGMSQWITKTGSLLGEYQWFINPAWTVFFGGRIDQNSYTTMLFSPRFTGVYTPSTTDTFKLILTRSARIKFAEELKAEYDLRGKPTAPEYLNSVEIRYEKQPVQQLFFATSVFYQDLALSDLLSSSNATLVTGHQTHVGVEAECFYQSDQWRFGVSHGYTKLLDFDLSHTDYLTQKSSEPYGFGSNLSNWSDHISKFFTTYRMTDRLSFNGSLRIYWGSPGSKSYLKYQIASGKMQQDVSKEGLDKYLEPSAFLNLGATYRANKKTTIQLNAYNLMGLVSRDYNKRFYFNGYSAYRIQAPAIAVSVRYLFSGSDK